jgi:type VI protein secretion system component VasF
MLRVTMTTSTPYAPARLARGAYVRMRRMHRRASRAEAVARAAVLAAVLATLAVGLTGALRSSSEQLAARLDAAAHVSASTR